MAESRDTWRQYVALDEMKKMERDTRKQEKLQEKEIKQAGANRSAFAFQVGEKIGDMSSKAMGYQTKNILDKSTFMDSKLMTLNDPTAMSTFGVHSAIPGMPGAELFGQSQVTVNPTLWSDLGKTLVKSDPTMGKGISSRFNVGATSEMETIIGKEFAQNMTIVDIPDISKHTQRLIDSGIHGDELSTVLKGEKTLVDLGEQGLKTVDPKVAEQAKNLTMAETQLASEMGKYGKAAQGISTGLNVLNVGKGIYDVATSESTEDTVLGLGNIAASGAILGAEAAAAGTLGTGAVAAGFASAGPAGWVGLAGLSAYEMGKSFDLWG